MRKTFPKRIEARRESAAVRQQERNKRSDLNQLTELNARGHGHCKEADRLFAKLNQHVQDVLNKVEKS